MQNNIKLVLLFLAVFLLHLAVIYSLQFFNPFSSITNDSPDFREYEAQAQTIADRAHKGVFSMQGLEDDLPKDLGKDLPDHYYPVIIGYLVAIFGASPMFIGQILNAIIAGLCAILLFLIAKRLGAGTTASFVFAFASSCYPTWLLISSLFHEDAMVVLLALLALLFGVKALESFTWKNVFAWYALVIVAALFRSFMGPVLGISFLVSYIFLHQDGKEKKIKNSVRIALLVFFVSFIAEALYRLSGLMAHGHSIEWIFQLGYTKNPLYHYHPDLWNFEGWFSGGWYSGVLALMHSFLTALLGPFPWSLSWPKGFFYLAEILPWLIIIPLLFKGLGRAFEKTKPALYLAVFAGAMLLLIALYVETREPEVMMRLRIPAFLALLPFCAAAFPFNLLEEWKKLLKYVI